MSSCTFLVKLYNYLVKLYVCLSNCRFFLSSDTFDCPTVDFPCQAVHVMFWYKFHLYGATLSMAVVSVYSATRGCRCLVDDKCKGACRNLRYTGSAGNEPITGGTFKLLTFKQKSGNHEHM